MPTFRALRNLAVVAVLMLTAARGDAKSDPCASFTNPGNTIYAYANPAGQLRSVTCPDACRPNETSLEWSIVGPQGPPGAGSTIYYTSSSVTRGTASSDWVDHPDMQLSFSLDRTRQSS